MSRLTDLTQGALSQCRDRRENSWWKKGDLKHEAAIDAEGCEWRGQMRREMVGGAVELNTGASLSPGWCGPSAEGNL